VEDLADSVASRIDVLVNNAGMAASGDLQDSLLVGMPFYPNKPMHSSLPLLNSLDSSERQPLQQPGAVISNKSDVSHHLLGGRTSSAISAAAFKMRLLTCVAGDVELWEKMITLNLITPMRLTRILAPHLAKRNPGRLILSPDSSCIPNIS